MNAQEFLELILPEEGFLIGLAKKDGQNRQAVFENDIPGLLAFLHKMSKAGWNVYHAPASFVNRRGTKNVKTGKYEHPRGQANVYGLGCLYGDVDTQESHPKAKYKTRVEAYHALVNFCRAARLPLPVFVDSGGGIHFYWLLDEILGPREWFRLADALKRACIHFKLDADHRLTANSAAVLRTPGFLHQRLQRLVTPSDEVVLHSPTVFSHLLEEFPDDERLRSVSTHNPVQPGSGSQTIIRKLSQAGWDSPSDPATLARNCVQIGRVIARPDTAGEPLHRLTAGAFKNCEPGGEQFYLAAISDDWRAVARDKLDRWNTGPPYCASFDEANPGGCAGCRFFDGSKKGLDRFRFKSAVHAGRQAVRETQPAGSNEAPAETHRGEQAAPQAVLGAYVGGEASRPGETGAKAEVNGHHSNGASSPLAVILKGIPLPAPYAWDKKNRLVIPGEDNDGNDDPLVISEQAIYLEGVHKSEAHASHGTVYAFKQWNPYDGWTAISVPAGDFHSAAAMVSLHNAGANIHDSARFKDFVRKSVDMVTVTDRRTARFEQCGWKKDEHGNRYGFLIGASLVEKQGTKEVIVNDELQTRSQWLGPMQGGNVRRWREILLELMPDYDHAGWFTLLCSLGSVFISWMATNESGGIMNNRELSSGTGKTTRLKAACSVWGRWHGLVIKNYDTGPSQGFTRAALCHLPIIHDELAQQALQSKNPTAIIEYVHLSSEGQDKRRMMMGGSALRYCMGDWANIELTASNHSCSELTIAQGRGSDSAWARILELHSRTDPHLTPKQAEDLTEELWKHSGHAGRLFMEALLRDHMSFAEERIRYWSNWIYANTNLRQRHRFWVRQITCAAVAGEVAEKMGMLLPIDFRKIIMAVLQAIGALTGQERDDGAVTGGDGDLAMTQFFTENWPNTMQVNGPFQPGIPPCPPVRAPTGKLLIRQELGNRRAFFSAAVFRAFCIANHFSYDDCMRKLEASKFVLHRDKFATLGAGTTIPSGPRVRCIECDLDHPLATQLPREVSNA